MAFPRRRMSDDNFRRMRDDAIARHNISDVVGKWVKLRRTGREFEGLCLNHAEKSPSMRVNDTKGKVYCFGCGYHADIIQVVQDQVGLGFMDALRWLGAEHLPIVDEAERIRAREEDEADRLRDIADARKFWDAGADPRGTPAEVYLREVRGITKGLPPSIRFGHVPAGRDKLTGEWRAPMPAVLCAVYDRGGAVVGIQRIFLRDGGRAKANMKRPKLTLGRIRGGSLRLGPPQPTIIVCEGPEDGLTLAQEIPGSSVWPTLGTGLMPIVAYPEEVTEIVIAGQNDGAGKAAVDAAGQALLEQGFAVRTMFPDPAFKDWNDQLRGVRK
jgi:DNA primase